MRRQIQKIMSREIDAERIYGSPGQRLAHVIHEAKARFRSKEKKRVQFLASFFPPSGTVIEVGAHFGYLTKEFAQVHAGSCMVYGFEPLPYNFGILQKVTRSYSNVVIRNQALSDSDGTADLMVPVKKQGKIGPGLAHFGQETERDYIRHKVETVRMDRAASDLGLSRLDFIKMDVEGAELLVLRGGEETLRRFKPVIYAEIDPAFTTRLGYTPKDLFDFLLSMGYRAHQPDEARNAIIPVSGFEGPYDYLFRCLE
jgi:FkbM family methyltransferase